MSLYHSIDATGIAETAASVIGVLAGLTFAGAIPPLVMMLDRQRESEDNMTSIVNYFHALEQSVGSPSFDAVCIAGSEIVERAKAMDRGAQAIETTFSLLVLVYIDAGLRTLKSVYAENEFRNWEAYKYIDFHFVEADSRKKDLPHFAGVRLLLAERRTENIVELLRRVINNDIFTPRLRRISSTIMGISALLSAYSFLILDNALAHDAVLYDTHILVKQICYAALTLIGAASASFFIAQFVLLFSSRSPIESRATRGWIVDIIKRVRLESSKGRLWESFILCPYWITVFAISYWM